MSDMKRKDNKGRKSDKSLCEKEKEIQKSLLENENRVYGNKLSCCSAVRASLSIHDITGYKRLYHTSLSYTSVSRGSPKCKVQMLCFF